MSRFKSSVFVLCIAVLLLGVMATAQAQTGGPTSADISFTVSLPKPWTHLLEVEMRLKVAANLNVPNQTNLIMPVWTPGSYLVREFERFFREAVTEVRGRSPI